jgi:ERF superfamily
MSETETKDRAEAALGAADVQEAPAPQLPATIKQDAAPRLPRAPKAAKPAQYSSRIAAALLRVGKAIGQVQKAGENDFHHYFYARWEDINEILSPLLFENDLLIVQNEISRSLLEKDANGSVLAIVYHFTFVNSEGESWPPVEWTAIARLTDKKGTTDDKAASKCHTQAEKFFSLKAFKIRTKDLGAEDATPTLPKKDARDVYTKLQAEIDAAATDIELVAWGKENIARKKTLPPDWQDILTERYNEKLGDLKNQRRGMADYVDEETGEIKPHPAYKSDPMPE